MVVYTSRLCHDVAFLPTQENHAHPITCQPVISESERPEWTLRQIEEDKLDKEELLALENENPLREMTEGADGVSKRRPIIGGIEVGAQALVGSEGKIIEKSVIAGGGKETYIDTVADSTGKQMSAAEMKKLNINDPEHVEELKKNVKEYAGTRGWKLDLVDTPRGPQFRGVIEADDDEEPGADGTPKKKTDGKTKKSEGKEKVDKEQGSTKGMQKDGKVKGKKEKLAVTKKGALKQQAEESEEGSEEVYKDEL